MPGCEGDRAGGGNRKKQNREQGTNAARALKWFITALKLDPAITLYSRRHSYATELRRVSDMRTVQRRLGHVSIHTTEQYLHEIEPESHPTEALPWCYRY